MVRLLCSSLVLALACLGCQDQSQPPAAPRAPATTPSAKPAAKAVPAAADKAAPAPKADAPEAQPAEPAPTAQAAEAGAEAKLDKALAVLEADRPRKHGLLEDGQAVSVALDAIHELGQAAAPAIPKLLAYLKECDKIGRAVPSDDWDLSMPPIDRPCKQVIGLLGDLAYKDNQVVAVMNGMVKAKYHFSADAEAALESMEQKATDEEDAAAK